ncbi:WD repeat-containing protein 18 isoform X2 [Gouania willdenowi]|uniref:WD repeat-containing protein 18 n=1 Tax=Gouania willdenowi TaxID=441366 RepID=A0A8C5D681_GOUWI|nr:WD repeat-containing protein 18 isoform X2 [Gouania willdenowi]
MVVVSSDSGSPLWSCSVWDLHGGASLLSYRGSPSSARGLTVLRDGFVLSAQPGKNFISAWELHRKEPLQQKIMCPSVVTCLTASHDGFFLAAGVSESVYLWEVCSGKLLSVLSRHYQEVTCVAFTDDSSHVVTGGKDNMALVWSLSSVVQVDAGSAPDPRHVLARHSLPIADLHCGMMGAQARVATASLDQTVKVWELSSGELLLSVLFDTEILSVTFDPCEYFLFCGGSDGNIFQVSLCTQNTSRDKSFQSDVEGNQLFRGHNDHVTCLSVSLDGTLLLSGSHDETVRVWDVQSKQCVRCIQHKGHVTNAFIMTAPANMFIPDSRPITALPRFSRQLTSEGAEPGEVCVRPTVQSQEEEETYLEKCDRLNLLMNAVTDRLLFTDGDSKVRVTELEEEVKTLKKVNKDLFDFSSQLLTKHSHT